MQQEPAAIYKVGDECAGGEGEIRNLLVGKQDLAGLLCFLLKPAAVQSRYGMRPLMETFITTPVPERGPDLESHQLLT